MKPPSLSSDGIWASRSPPDGRVNEQGLLEIPPTVTKNASLDDSPSATKEMENPVEVA
jgi:hypothetical protein